MRSPNGSKVNTRVRYFPPNIQKRNEEVASSTHPFAHYEVQKRQPTHSTNTQLIYARLTHCYMQKSLNLSQNRLYLRNEPDIFTTSANAHYRFRSGTAPHLNTKLAPHQAPKGTLPPKRNTPTFTQSHHTPSTPQVPPGTEEYASSQPNTHILTN